MTKLTAIVLTHNESEHISDCLETLSFADECIVFDSYSTDNTVDLARSAGARVIRHKFENFASQRNAALDSVTGTTDWVLFIDADERVTPELAEEVRQVIMQRHFSAYQIPRHNYIFGKLTQGAGWYPDYQTRLLKIGKVRYQNPVHEIATLDGELGALQHHLIHHNYKNLTHFLEKQRKYVQYDAQIMFEAGTRPEPQNYLLQPLRHFKWRFFELSGYRDGWHGFRLSVLMAWYELKKYLILRRMWQDDKKA